MSPSTRRRTGRPPSDATNRGKARDPAATCFVNWCAANVQRSTTRARRMPTAADTGPEPPSPPPPSPPSGYHPDRSEEHTSEIQSLMRNSYALFCLKKKTIKTNKKSKRQNIVSLQIKKQHTKRNISN